MDELLDLLREEVPREIESRVGTALGDRGRCVQSTRVGIEVLKYFGFQGRPLVTLMMTGNAAWVAWMMRGQPDPMPDEVWAVGIDPEPSGKGYPAHLVIAIGGMLLDLDAGFYARPHKGIHLPTTVLTPISQREQGKPIAAHDLEGGGAIVYYDRSVFDTPPPDFHAINAWKQTGKWAGPVIRRMREKVKGAAPQPPG